ASSGGRGRATAWRCGWSSKRRSRRCWACDTRSGASCWPGRLWWLITPSTGLWWRAGWRRDRDRGPIIRSRTDRIGSRQERDLRPKRGIGTFGHSCVVSAGDDAWVEGALWRSGAGLDRALLGRKPPDLSSSFQPLPKSVLLSRLHASRPSTPQLAWW